MDPFKQIGLRGTLGHFQGPPGVLIQACARYWVSGNQGCRHGDPYGHVRVSSMRRRASTHSSSPLSILSSSILIPSIRSSPQSSPIRACSSQAAPKAGNCRRPKKIPRWTFLKTEWCFFFVNLGSALLGHFQGPPGVLIQACVRYWVSGNQSCRHGDPYGHVRASSMRRRASPHSSPISILSSSILIPSIRSSPQSSPCLQP